MDNKMQTVALTVKGKQYFFCGRAIPDSELTVHEDGTEGVVVESITIYGAKELPEGVTWEAL